MGCRKQEVPSEMTAETHVSDVCCVGLQVHTKGSDLITDVQVWHCKFPHDVVREDACSHPIPDCFVSCVKCCISVLSPVTVDSRNSFLYSLNH